MQIKTIVKKWDNTCTLSSNLTENAVKEPAVRDVMEYAEPRMLTTLIVSGAKSPWDTVGNTTKSKIGTVPADKLIGDSAYRYFIMGRIQRKSFINGQVGSSGSDGSFQLRIQDSLLYPGMNVQFYDGVVARVMAGPTNSTSAGGGFVYLFKTINGAVFDYAASVAAQPGQKTCFGGYSSYGEASRRGYGRAFYPDQFIQHMTIQRKSISISGSALTDVVWVKYKQERGWYWEKERQMRLQFNMENEHEKWFGVSSMRDANGDLLAQSTLIDPETGNPIIQGDGIVPQIEDGNVSWGSGTDGYATIDDHMDMIKTLKKYSSTTWGTVQRWVIVTGPDGYVKAQTALREYWRTSFNGTHMAQGNALPDITVGGMFDTFTFANNNVTFVEHPMFGDTERWSNVASDGDPMQSGMYIYLDMGQDMNNRTNVEILTKGSYGINRSLVSSYFNGLTGYNKDAVVPVDALQYDILKEDMITVYQPKACGIIKRSPF